MRVRSESAVFFSGRVIPRERQGGGAVLHRVYKVYIYIPINIYIHIIIHKV